MKETAKRTEETKYRRVKPGVDNGEPGVENGEPGVDIVKKGEQKRRLDEPTIIAKRRLREPRIELFQRFYWMPAVLSPNSSCPLLKQAIRLGYPFSIRTHSPSSVLVSKLNSTEFRIKDMEMIKGIYDQSRRQNYDNDELLVIPIIDIASDDAFDVTMVQYPSTSAILVRNHGLVVFGDSFVKAKIMTECYEYLFEIWHKMHIFGLPLHYH